MKIETPFYPQKWELSKWKELGFESFKDAEYWEKSSCGVLSLKMAIDSFLLKQGKSLSPSIAVYIKKGIEINAYTDLVGWIHKGLAQLAREFGFEAVDCRADAKKIYSFLKENSLPIISIRWAFKNNKSLREKIMFWRKSNCGHLALAVGFEEENGRLKGFYVHHTSIIPEYNWQYRFIPIKEFKKGFTGRCIAISSK